MGRDLTAGSRLPVLARGIRGMSGRAGRAGPATEVIIADAIPGRGLAGPFPRTRPAASARAADSRCRSLATSKDFDRPTLPGDPDGVGAENEQAARTGYS